MYNDLLYQIALTRVPQVGDVHAKNLVQLYGSAEAIFKAPKQQLENWKPKWYRQFPLDDIVRTFYDLGVLNAW